MFRLICSYLSRVPLAELGDYIDLDASRNAIYCKLKRAWAKAKNMRITGKLCWHKMKRKHRKLKRAKAREMTWEKENKSLNLAIKTHNR